MSRLLRRAAPGEAAVPARRPRRALNELGYDLYRRKQKDAAIEIFRLNTELYPQSGNAYDSLAETYLRLGDEARAKELYAKALAVQPDYANAKEARRIVEGKAN